ncbi:hypothetical protein [Sporisorium scitamineum]|uniref:Uncharacterized protein n=1 Tax=Sporisorium scitamineum TaxID=49012 RepID=A0A0F7S5U0_9BASI|nr:hypothetical protein [Sporisorium scitamineum]
MFLLVVAGLAAAGLLALMLLIAIARCIAHDQLRRDNLRKSYSFDDSHPPSSSSSKHRSSVNDKFTSTPANLATARSLRRTMTKKKLGSFARRTQDGSVLIEVGDEVFAVPPHLADSYRERMLREKRSQSDLTAVVEDGGLFGSVKPKYLTDGGPDGDEEQARAKYDSMLGGGGVGRSLSQRLGDRLRALKASAPVDEKVDRGVYSFDGQHQQVGAMRQADLGRPVVTTGGAGLNQSLPLGKQPVNLTEQLKSSNVQRTLLVHLPSRHNRANQHPNSSSHC